MGQETYRPKRLAEKLLRIREVLGLTQREMAERLTDKLGFKVTRKKISQYEHGKRILHLEVGLAYARVGNVSFEQIVDDDLDLKLSP
jgi:transcriptional regulator with XRE-family HTH domain